MNEWIATGLTLSPNSFASTPLIKDFSILLCHTKRSVKLASPKGLS